MSLTAAFRRSGRPDLHVEKRTSATLVAGIFCLITFVSIPTLTLYNSVKSKDYTISSGADAGALWGCFLEVIVALSGIGTAVTLFPVVKRRGDEGRALGLVASRTLEAAAIFTGVARLLSLVTLRQDLVTATGASAASLITIGVAHVAAYNCAFTLGQSPMPGINALLLGTLKYRSGLLPHAFPCWDSSDPLGTSPQ